MALHRGPAPTPTGPTERWSMECVSDALADGRPTLVKLFAAGVDRLLHPSTREVLGACVVICGARLTAAAQVRIDPADSTRSYANWAEADLMRRIS